MKDDDWRNWKNGRYDNRYDGVRRHSGKRYYGRRKFGAKQIAIITIGLVAASLFVLVVGVPGLPQLQLPEITLPNLGQTNPSQTHSETPQGQNNPTPSSNNQVFSNCIMASNGAGGIRVNCENHDSVQCIADPPIGSGIQKDVTLTIDKNSCIIQYTNSQGSNTVYNFQLGTSSSVTSQNPSNTPSTPPSIIPKVTFSKITLPKVIIPKVTLPDITSVIPQAIPPPSLDELKQIALDDINSYRKQAGISPVSLGSAKASQLYAEVLLKEGCIHHIADNGDDPMQRYQHAGDALFNVGENLSGGSGTSYMSPIDSIKDANHRMMFEDADQGNGHRDNILNPSHLSASLGIAYDSQRLVLVEDFEDPYSPYASYVYPDKSKSCW